MPNPAPRGAPPQRLRLSRGHPHLPHLHQWHLGRVWRGHTDLAIFVVANLWELLGDFTGKPWVSLKLPRKNTRKRMLYAKKMCICWKTTIYIERGKALGSFFKAQWCIPFPGLGWSPAMEGKWGPFPTLKTNKPNCRSSIRKSQKL